MTVGPPGSESCLIAFLAFLQRDEADLLRDWKDRQIPCHPEETMISPSGVESAMEIPVERCRSSASSWSLFASFGRVAPISIFGDLSHAPSSVVYHAKHINKGRSRKGKRVNG